MTVTDAIRDTRPKQPKGPARALRPVRPKDNGAGGKVVTRLAQTDILFANIQMITDGGDNNLHAHAGMDGLWFVLAGCARFYGPGQDDVIGEVGPRQAVLIPRNFPYWFEKVGEEELEILQVEAIDKSVRNTRTDFGAITQASSEARIYSLDGELLRKGYEKEPG